MEMKTDDLEMEVSIGSFVYLKCTLCEKQCEAFRKWKRLFQKGEGCELTSDSRD
jgi:uncharacterized Fe-S radical SAM superfamily protein PflX